MDAETPYDLPSGERIWVSETASAAEHLSALLKRFREGGSQPLIFGDAGEPEAVVISWAEWSRLDALVGDVEGFDDTYETELEWTTDARSESSAPLGDAESEIDWDLNGDLDDFGAADPLNGSSPKPTAGRIASAIATSDPVASPSTSAGDPGNANDDLQSIADE
jgi:hypothetical protein